MNLNSSRDEFLLKRFHDLIEKGGVYYSVKNCANALLVCPDHLNRLCKKHYSMTAKQIINRERYELSKIKLENKEISITDIAFELGFSEVSSFCRFFRKKEGLSPTEYRRRYFLLK